MRLAQKHTHISKHTDCYLYDSCGVGRIEGRGVVVNIGDINVNSDSGGHSRRATVKCLH